MSEPLTCNCHWFVILKAEFVIEIQCFTCPQLSHWDHADCPPLSGKDIEKYRSCLPSELRYTRPVYSRAVRQEQQGSIIHLNCGVPLSIPGKNPSLTDRT
jgi:hypothetical protein